MPTRQTFCFEHLWRTDRIGLPVPSPDGNRLVVPITSVNWPDQENSYHPLYPQPENDARTDLWLVDAGRPDRDARRLTWDGGSNPAWSPCGSWIVFTRERAVPGDDADNKKRDDLPQQLWRLPMNGPGEAERLTSMPTAVSSPKVFPNGRYIAFVADTWPGMGPDMESLAQQVKEEEDDPVQARITDRRLVRYWDEYRTDGRLPHVFVVDLETGAVRDLMAGMDGLLHFMDLRWDLHPEGTEIAFARNATEPPWTDVRVEIALIDLDVEANFATRAWSVVQAESPFACGSTWDSSPTYLPDGRLAFTRSLRPGVSADFSRLMLWDGNEVRELLPGWDSDPSALKASPDGEELVFLAQERGYQKLYTAAADAAAVDGPRRLDPWHDGSVVGVQPLKGGRVACLRQGFHRPTELWLLASAGSHDPVRLGSWNGELRRQIDFGSTEPESVTFEVPKVDAKGGEGGTTESQMFVLHPPGFDPSRRYPLLLLLHGGPHSAWLDSFHQRWNVALLAAGGRVVAALNPHGSTGFGQAYAESVVGRHADQPFADAMAAVDLLLARGYLDPTRLAVAGGSYGGYLTSWVIGHTDRFAAAICHAGVYDLMAQFASDYSWSRGNNYGAEPWEDPTMIDRQSPSRFASGFTTPTLVIHGEKDYRVPVTQGLNLYSVLQGQGVPSKLVVFPQENHWVLKPRAAQLWWHEVDAWLDRWIGRGPSEPDLSGLGSRFSPPSSGYAS